MGSIAFLSEEISLLWKTTGFLDLWKVPENTAIDETAESLLVFLFFFLLPPSITETGEAVTLSTSPQTDSGHRLSVWVATE